MNASSQPRLKEIVCKKEIPLPSEIWSMLTKGPFFTLQFSRISNSACEGCKGLAVPEAAVPYLLSIATLTRQTVSPMPFCKIKDTQLPKTCISEPSSINRWRSRSDPCNLNSFSSCPIFQLGEIPHPSPSLYWPNSNYLRIGSLLIKNKTGESSSTFRIPLF